MQNNTNKLGIPSMEDIETLQKAQEIFTKKSSKKFILEAKNYKLLVNKKSILSLHAYFQLLKILANKKINFTFLFTALKLSKYICHKLSKSISKDLFYTSKDFYRKSKNLYHSYLVFLHYKLDRVKFKALRQSAKTVTETLDFNLLKKKLKTIYINRIYREFLKVKPSNQFLKIFIKNLNNKLKINFLKKRLAANNKAIHHFKPLEVLNLISKIEIKLFFLRKKFITYIQNNLLEIKNDYFITFVLKNLKHLLNKLELFSNKSKLTIKNFISIYLNPKQLSNYINRLCLIIALYFLPFIILATQALVPLSDGYEYFIVNSFSGKIFNTIPPLISLIKIFQPLTTNSQFLFGLTLVYYFTFTSGYKSLNISYKVALNATMASIFLILSYCFQMIEYLTRFLFELLHVITNIVFHSYLIKHLSKRKRKLGDLAQRRNLALKLFANLIDRYDSQIPTSYYQFLLFINHYIYSHLALISLAALLYNCIYYVIHNRNPEIILVTKTALATIKAPNEEN